MKTTYVIIPTPGRPRSFRLVGPGLSSERDNEIRLISRGVYSWSTAFDLHPDDGGGTLTLSGGGRSPREACAILAEAFQAQRYRLAVRDIECDFFLADEKSIPAVGYDDLTDDPSFVALAGYSYGESENITRRAQRLATFFAFDLEMQIIGAERQAAPYRTREYRLFTTAGLLTLSVDPKPNSIWSFNRFDEPDRARGTGCNPYSGKWNHSYGAFEFAPIARPFSSIGACLASRGLLASDAVKDRERAAYEARQAALAAVRKHGWSHQYTEAEIAEVKAAQAEAERIRQDNIAAARGLRTAA